MAITQTTAADENASIESLDDREVRALTEVMSVLDDVPPVDGAEDMYAVVSGSEKTYVVDVGGDEPHCTCKDHQFRAGACKHIVRTEIELGVRAIPGWIDESALDDQIGMHLDDAEPRFAATDGGVAATDGGTVAARGDQDDGAEVGASIGSRIGFVVGVDGKGDVHAHYPAAEAVRVYDVGEDYEVGDRLEDDDVVWTQDLSATTLAAWMAHIDDERHGWETVTHRAPDSFAGGEE